ncbi:carbohydrate ABC transporter permease [Polymorphospora rubra]|uniref:Sugar ABC transporter permease n=1 Tax=Polymorphospora rubra TaxID=338584 RepID=A0A810MUA0_9ACTN|nr:carbohydrate ABC transporter permease [Polymorphospora rubra]BCJ64090.1 sugar ABC transporter permease [Polymorphospora rubra]
MSSTRSRLLRVGVAIVLIVGAVLVSVPFLWMLAGSVKPESEVLDIPPTLWPKDFTWDNYVQLFESLDFGIYLGNTLMVVALSMVGLLLRAMAGYGFAKYDFPGKGPIYVVVLATMMIPDQVTMIPTYLILNQLGLTNTITGIVLPGLVSAFSVFLFRQFFTTVPNELLEAARLDGAGEVRIFLRVVAPLSGPILAIQGVLTFIASWNSFLWPLIVATDQDRYTLSVGLALLEGQYASNYGVLMAGAAVMVLPILVVFVFCQRWVVRGFMMSGLK